MAGESKTSQNEEEGGCHLFKMGRGKALVCCKRDGGEEVRNGCTHVLVGCLEQLLGALYVRPSAHEA